MIFNHQYSTGLDVSLKLNIYQVEFKVSKQTHPALPPLFQCPYPYKYMFSSVTVSGFYISTPMEDITIFSVSNELLSL